MQNTEEIQTQELYTPEKPPFDFLQNLSEQAQDHLQYIQEILPTFVEVSDLQPTYDQDQKTELKNALQKMQDQFPEIKTHVFKTMKQLEINTPYMEFQSVFKLLNEQFFSEFLYIEPKMSAFYQNEELPSMEGIKKFLNDQENNIKEQDVLLYHMKAVDSKQLQMLLAKIFNFFNGKIPRIFNSFLFFPDHLLYFWDSFEEIFITPGPLPLEQVYYITLMTAAASGNNYVYNLFAERFIKLGGNQDWIFEGYNALPIKLQKIWEMVWANIYHPSLIFKNYDELFEYLCGEGDSGEKLNQAEITFAMLIINFADYLVTLAFGIGLVDVEYPEDEQISEINNTLFLQFSLKKQGSSFGNSSSGNNSGQDIQDQQDQKQQQQQQQKQVSLSQILSKQNSNASIDQQQQNILNQKISTNEVINLLQKSNIEQEEVIKKQELREVSSEDDLELLEFVPKLESKFSKYSKYSVVFCNKTVKKQKEFLTENSYNWNMNLNQQLNERGYDKLMKKMNAKLQIVRSMTNGNFGKEEQLDTSKFRDSIWSYVEIVLGYKQQTQSYREITTFLNKQFRNFVRKLTLQPWDIKYKDFQQIPYLFKPVDYMHVVLLAAESKFSIRLMYGFYCFEQFKDEFF